MFCTTFGKSAFSNIDKMRRNEGLHFRLSKSPHCCDISGRRVSALLTFQHLNGHLGDSVGFLLVQSNGLPHHHLAKASLPKGLPKHQPVGRTGNMELISGQITAA